MEIEGTIKAIFDMQTFESGFMKQEMVVETKENYPQPILVQFVKDKTSLLNDLAEGMEVKVSINLRGREWTSPKGEVKYFNAIEGWKVTPLSAAQPAAAPTRVKQADVAPSFEHVPSAVVDAIADDDLPF